MAETEKEAPATKGACVLRQHCRGVLVTAKGISSKWVQQVLSFRA